MLYEQASMMDQVKQNMSCRLHLVMNQFIGQAEQLVF